MPRPKPDKIVRHQIVFGEADRKILSAAVDSYNFNTIMGNITKVLNDVTGTITLLTLLAASGALGLVFVFNVSPLHLASGNFPAIYHEFMMQYNAAYAEKIEKRQEERDQARAAKAEDIANRIRDDPLGAAADISGNPIIKIADFLFGKDSGAVMMNQNFGAGATYDPEDGLKFN